MTAEPWLKRWLNRYAFLGVLVLAVFWMMDGVTEYRPGAPITASPEAVAKPAGGAGRVFILLIDSLRYQTAISPDLMPNLSALRSTGVWAEVRPSYNAVTVPCLRAAFTGRDEVSVLSFVQNFVHQDAAIESLFSQMASLGYHVAAYSDGSFEQFGAAINPSFTTNLGLHAPGVEDYDDHMVERALERFREGGEQIVVVHVRYTDYSAHQYGVAAANYRRDFRRADKLVALADSRVGRADTLVVMGDHGHDIDGSHSLGQPVSTFTVYRGPRFKRDHDLGPIDITSHRWLLSQVLGIEVPRESYLGGQYPAALIDSPVSATSIAALSDPTVREVPAALWISLAVLAVLGAGVLWAGALPWTRPKGATGIVWLALLPALLPLPWNGWVGAAVGLALCASLLRGSPLKDWGLTAGAVVIAATWHVWGRALALLRPAMETITHEQLVAGWLVVGVAAALVATRRNRGWGVAALGGAGGFLALPTNSRYGFAGMMVPLLWLWLVTYAASLAKEGRLKLGKEAGVALGLVLLIFGFTEAFAGIDARHFLFQHFVSLISFAPLNPETLLERAVVAKAILFFAVWPRRWAPAALKLGLIAMLQAVEWRSWEPNGWESAGMIAALMTAWRWARRRDDETASALLLGLLLFLFAYCVRPVRESYLWADCMLAGLVLAARWMRRFPQPERARADYLLLGIVALLATGFFTVSWSIERLEWSRIYTWFPAKLVESLAFVLVPWIAAKTVLPLLIARFLMRRELHGYATWPGENISRLVGLKVLTLLLVLTGIGATGTVSTVYLEGVQQLTVLVILSLGLAGQQPRQLPAEAGEKCEEKSVPEIQQQNRPALQLE